MNTNQTYWVRLKNPAVIMSIAGYILAIVADLGFAINSQAVLSFINAACSFLVILGILNNPETSGMDLPRLGGNKIKK